MPRRPSLFFALLVSGCGPETVHLELDDAAWRMVATVGPSGEVLAVESGPGDGALELEPAPAATSLQIWSFEAGALIGDDGDPVDPSRLTARAADAPAPGGSCGRCLAPSTGPTQRVFAGDACPPLASAEVSAWSVDGARREPPLVASEAVRFDVEGACACPTPERPVGEAGRLSFCGLVPEEPWLVEGASVMRDGTVLVAGDRELRVFTPGAPEDRLPFDNEAGAPRIVEITGTEPSAYVVLQPADASEDRLLAYLVTGPPGGRSLSPMPIEHALRPQDVIEVAPGTLWVAGSKEDNLGSDRPAVSTCEVQVEPPRITCVSQDVERGCGSGGIHRMVRRPGGMVAQNRVSVLMRPEGAAGWSCADVDLLEKAPSEYRASILIDAGDALFSCVQPPGTTTGVQELEIVRFTDPLDGPAEVETIFRGPGRHCRATRSIQGGPLLVLLDPGAVSLSPEGQVLATYPAAGRPSRNTAAELFPEAEFAISTVTVSPDGQWEVILNLSVPVAYRRRQGERFTELFGEPGLGPASAVVAQGVSGDLLGVSGDQLWRLPFDETDCQRLRAAATKARLPLEPGESVTALVEGDDEVLLATEREGGEPGRLLRAGEDGGAIDGAQLPSGVVVRAATRLAPGWFALLDGQGRAWASDGDTLEPVDEQTYSSLGGAGGVAWFAGSERLTRLHGGEAGRYAEPNLWASALTESAGTARTHAEPVEVHAVRAWCPDQLSLGVTEHFRTVTGVDVSSALWTLGSAPFSSCGGAEGPLELCSIGLTDISSPISGFFDPSSYVTGYLVRQTSQTVAPVPLSVLGAAGGPGRLLLAGAHGKLAVARFEP